MGSVRGHTGESVTKAARHSRASQAIKASRVSPSAKRGRTAPDQRSRNASQPGSTETAWRSAMNIFAHGLADSARKPVSVRVGENSASSCSKPEISEESVYELDMRMSMFSHVLEPAYATNAYFFRREAEAPVSKDTFI